MQKGRATGINAALISALFLGLAPVFGKAAMGKLRGSLPGLVVRGFVSSGRQTASGMRPLDMQLDPVVFVLDHARIHLVWRGAMVMADRSAAAGQAIRVVTEQLGRSELGHR